MKILGLFAIFLSIANATLFSDTGCGCATTKSTTITPNASTTATAGCAFKANWTGGTSRWCLTDESLSQCGTFQPTFGFVDTCAIAAFTKVNVLPPPLIEWDQTQTTYYTGQIMNITWESANIGIDEWVRVQYQGQTTRTLTSGSGTNLTIGSFATRLTDSTNNPTNGRVPVTVNLPSNALITRNSDELIQVILSKLMNVAVYDGTRLMVSGQTAVCDDRNFTIQWRGLGQAQFGTATITLNQNGFGNPQLGTTLTNVPVVGNTTAYFLCSRTWVPSSSRTYSFQISVAESGQAAYTATSASFSLTQAPTPSNTPTPSMTPTKTPTPTPSITPSVSATPSQTPSITSSRTPSNTPTPSETPSITPTPSTTPTALDLAAIGRAAAAAVDTTTPVIGAVIGSILGTIAIGIGVKTYMNHKMTERRKMKLKMSARFVEQKNKVYGLDEAYTNRDADPTAPSIVMYTVNMPAGGMKSKQAFAPAVAAKK